MSATVLAYLELVNFHKYTRKWEKERKIKGKKKNERKTEDVRKYGAFLVSLF